MSAPSIGRLAFKNIRAHKLRLLLSIFSVVLGTAFVSGSFVFTGTLQKTFDGLITDSSEGVSVVVSGQAEAGFGVPYKLREDIAQVEGVRIVEPVVMANVVLLDKDKKPMQSGGAPSQGIGWVPLDQTTSGGLTLVEGQEPKKDGEILLSVDVANKAGLNIGDRTTVITLLGGSIDTTLVGTYTLDTATGGYIGVIFPFDQARELFSDGTNIREFRVASDGSITDEQLRDRISAIASDYRVVTGSESVEKMKGEVQQGLSFINYFLLAFGLVSLLVGTFIIYNTFTMLVAQRLRELALLRAIGASRKQVVRSVMIEAVIAGVVGSILGTIAGFGLAKLIFVVMKAFDFGLPEGELALPATGLVYAILVGTVVTILSALVPAIRAGRIPPVQAMRAGLTSSEGSLVVRTVAGVVALLAGLGGIFLGLVETETKTAAIIVGIASGIIVLGTFLIMPVMARPIAGGIGRVLGAPFGTVGKMAAKNAGRNSRRTAATAFALTLGLMLVAAFGTLGSSTKASISELVDQGLTADFVVAGATATNGPPFPLPVKLGDEVGQVEGVDKAVQLRRGNLILGGGGTFFVSVSEDFQEVINTKILYGDPDISLGKMMISRKTAAEKGWQVGTVVPVKTVDLRDKELEVTAIYAENAVLGNYVTGLQTNDEFVPPQGKLLGAVFVKASSDISAQQLQSNLETAIEDYPVATAKTLEQFAGERAGAIDQLLNIIYGLLGLAVIIAILGIINTLALSVAERRTEVGMLRAIGMKRGQIRRMVYLESTQIAIFGAVVGALLGVILGWAFVQVMKNEGLQVVDIPWSNVVIMLIASAFVGVLASLWPAMKAARTSPLEAIAD